MQFVPNLRADREAMLARVGLPDIDSLFSDIPTAIKLKNGLQLKPAHSEMEIKQRLTDLAQNNLPAESYPTFMGGGAYRHFTPAVVDQMLLRSEFYTAYTPYQPEISQGVLQAIFEWQTYICLLTGMDVANASMYDGASALAEACLMAASITRKRQVAIPDNINPLYLQVVNTYLKGRQVEIIKVPTNEGIISADEQLSNVGAVVVGYPNFYGIVEPELNAIASIMHNSGGLLILCADPLALGLLKPPAEFGADIVVGDGQSLGLPLNFGGPYVGYLAAKEKYIRYVPGRLVGQTTDSRGEIGYVLTLQAREQHIRRDKASSNICSNEALCALAVTIYLATIGGNGLAAVAKRCHQLAVYGEQKLQSCGIELKYPNQPYFCEFVVKVDNPEQINQQLYESGIIGGIPVANDGLLLAFTEMNNCQQIDRLAAVMGGQ